MSQRFFDILRRAKLGDLNERPSELFRGIDINHADSEGRTPLLIASREGNVKQLVSLLITAKANVNAASRTGQTALHFAASGGHAALAAALLEARGDHSAREHHRGATPLHAAAAQGHVRVCALLALAGADLNARDKEGWPPCFWAAEGRHVAVIRALVQLSNAGKSSTKLDLLAQDRNGWRPAMLSSSRSLDDPVIGVTLAEQKEAYLAQLAKLKDYEANQKHRRQPFPSKGVLPQPLLWEKNITINNDGHCERAGVACGAGAQIRTMHRRAVVRTSLALGHGKRPGWKAHAQGLGRGSGSLSKICGKDSEEKTAEDDDDDSGGDWDDEQDDALGDDDDDDDCADDDHDADDDADDDDDDDDDSDDVIDAACGGDVRVDGKGACIPDSIGGDHDGNVMENVQNGT